MWRPSPSAVLQAPQLNSVATRHVAAMLDSRHSELTRVRSSLINDHHLLRSVGRGEVEIAIPRFGTWLQNQIAARNENGRCPLTPNSAATCSRRLARTTLRKRRDSRQSLSRGP